MEGYFLHTAGNGRTLSRDVALTIALKLQEEYRKEAFQRRLHTGWHAREDPVERIRWRQQICLEVQGPIISKYGFEASRRGVWHLVQAFRGAHNSDPEIGRVNSSNEWLTDPDMQAAVPPVLSEVAHQHGMSGWTTQTFRLAGCQPSPAAVDYRVAVTQPDDDAAVEGIERCQGALAGAHHALYTKAHPRLHQEDWFGLLGCQEVQDAIESGVLFLHAAAASSREVVGYLSAACDYDEKHTTVHHVAVLPHHRHRGVGRLLFQELATHLAIASPSVAGDLRLSVAEANASALEWYRRLGFTEVGQRFMELPNKAQARFLSLQRRVPPCDDTS